MDTQELKLQLIQWILEINNQETLELLWLWKDRQKQEREERFLAYLALGNLMKVVIN